MNPNPDTSGLKRGNLKNVGRKPAEVTRRRQNLLRELAAAEGHTVGLDADSIHDAARIALASLIKLKDGPTIRWYWDQQMGRAPVNTQEVLGEIEVFVALGRILPLHIRGQQEREDFLNDLQHALVELNANPTQSLPQPAIPL